MRETFVEATDHGGHDSQVPGNRRSLRYLEWTWDPDPDDTWYFDDFAYILREGGGAIHTVADRHRIGRFPRSTWFELLAVVGFVDVRAVPTGCEDLGEGDAGAKGFRASKPLDASR